MNNYNITNIKDLPQLEQILDGNFLVVENTTGTNKLDFSDFVIGPSNTSFASSVFSDIVAISSYSISVSSTTSAFLSATNSTINSLSSSVDSNNQTLNSLLSSASLTNLVIVRRGQFVIPGGSNTTTFSVTVPNLVNILYNSDFNIKQFAETDVVTNGYINGLNSRNNFFVYSLTGVPTTLGSNITHSVFVSASYVPDTDLNMTYTAVIPLEGDIGE